MTMTVEEIVAGTPVWFEYGGKRYQIVQPTVEQYDDAQIVQSASESLWRKRPEIVEVAEAPCSDEERAIFSLSIKRIEDQIANLPDDRQDEIITLRNRKAAMLREIEERTLADELVSDRALLARDRYLTKVLLRDEHGNRPEITLGLANAARQHVWKVIAAIDSIPFV